MNDDCNLQLKEYDNNTAGTIVMGEKSISPEEYVLHILCWINITCKVIWHLELVISSGDENIYAGCNANPKLICK